LSAQSASVATILLDQKFPIDNHGLFLNLIENDNLMPKLLAILFLSTTFIVTPVFAQSPTAASTTVRLAPFVVAAEALFRQELDAEKRGDVDAYKRTRSKATYDKTMANLERMGKSAADLGPMLKRFSTGVDISKFTFLRSDARENIARLLYRKDGKDQDGRATVEFLVFMMHWEEGSWHIGMVANSPGPLVFMHKERSIDELTNDPRFALN
jgi:hypothetical protein